MLVNCLKAYKGKLPPAKPHPLISPCLAEDALLRRLPPSHFFACKLDPLLDDTIAFCRRLHALGMDVQLNLYDNVSHGFLNFKDIGKDAGQAFMHSMLAIKDTIATHMAAGLAAERPEAAQWYTDDDPELPDENQPFAADTDTDLVTPELLGT